MTLRIDVRIEPEDRELYDELSGVPSKRGQQRRAQRLLALARAGLSVLGPHKDGESPPPRRPTPHHDEGFNRRVKAKLDF